MDDHEFIIVQKADLLNDLVTVMLLGGFHFMRRLHQSVPDLLHRHELLLMVLDSTLSEKLL